MSMREKQNLARAIGIQKENLEVTMHFSGIIERKYGKKMLLELWLLNYL